MAIAELIGSRGGVSCAMSTSGGVLACACLMAVLHVVIAADRVAEFVALYAMKLIEMVAECRADRGESFGGKSRRDFPHIRDGVYL